MEEAKEKFKANYYETEGIQLDHIEWNKGNRTFSKSVLNSLWKKPAQGDNLIKTGYISNDPSYYFELITDPTKVANHEYKPAVNLRTFNTCTLSASYDITCSEIWSATLDYNNLQTKLAQVILCLVSE